MKTATLLAAIALGAWAAAAHAAGDPEAGREKASNCVGCHMIPGYYNVYPSYRVPKLGNQHPEYIVQALKAYKNGDRNHPTMQAQAASLTEQDMQDLAAYLASAPRAETE